MKAYKFYYKVSEVEWSANYGQGLRGINDNSPHPRKQSVRMWLGDNLVYGDFETLFRAHPSLRRNVAKYGSTQPKSFGQSETVREQYLETLRKADAMQFVRDLLSEYNLSIG